MVIGQDARLKLAAALVVIGLDRDVKRYPQPWR